MIQHHHTFHEPGQVWIQKLGAGGRQPRNEINIKTTGTLKGKKMFFCNWAFVFFWAAISDITQREGWQCAPVCPVVLGPPLDFGAADNFEHCHFEQLSFLENCFSCVFVLHFFSPHKLLTFFGISGCFMAFPVPPVSRGGVLVRVRIQIDCT